MDYPGPKRTWLRKTLVSVFVAAGAGFGLTWSQQRQLIYFPDTGEVPPAADAVTDGRDVTLVTSDGLELGAWFVPPRGRDSRMAVLLAPGNGGNRSGRAGLAELLSRRGLAVLVIDYRGYGGNPGSPSEDGLARDADAAVSALNDLGYDSAHTIYFGESLGTGVVAALQERTPPAGIVLRSPFTSLVDVAAEHYPWLPARTLLRDRFPVLEHLQDSQVPTTVIYGDRDDIVPTRLSARVADQVGSLSERVVIQGVGHNDPEMFGQPVADATSRLAHTLRRSTRSGASRTP